MAKLIPLSQAAQKTKVSAEKIRAAAESGALDLVHKMGDMREPPESRECWVRITDLDTIRALRGTDES